MKTFVLDTNVILHDPNSLFAFGGSRVVLPLPVIEELDSFKRNNDERGRSARLIARNLDELRKRGHQRALRNHRAEQLLQQHHAGHGGQHLHGGVEAHQAGLLDQQDGKVTVIGRLGRK